MAVTGIGNNYNYAYGSTYVSPKNAATKDNASAQAGSTKNSKKAKELEETLSYFKEGYASGLKSAQANARAIGARLVNYSESWSIDSSGNVTMMASTTVTSDNGVKGWKEQAEEQKEKLKEKKQADKNRAANQRTGDYVDISEAGRSALEAKMFTTKRFGQTGDIKKLPSLSSGVFGIQNDFEKILSELGNGSVSDDFVTKDYSQAGVDAWKERFEEPEGTKTDTFDSYVNKMAAAYQLMRERMEEKYAASDRQKEFFTAADGSTQELTKEKELEMLDKAYETHSRFMAASTQIWKELQDFKVQTVYADSSRREQDLQNTSRGYMDSLNEAQEPEDTSGLDRSGSVQTKASAAKTKDTAVQEQAYQAFMSAIQEKNIGLLKQEEGNLNHLRLHLGISSSARDFLNRVWDYHANLKR